MPPRPNASSDEILVVTIQLIAEHDLSGVTVDMVADKAGVSKATIYRRWPSREDLFFEALSYMRYPQADPDTGSVRGDLAVLVKGLVNFLNRSDGGKVYAAFVNAAIRDPKLAALRREVAKNARADYERVLQRGIDRGELVADVNMRLVIDLLTGPFVYTRIIENVNARIGDVTRVIDVVLSAFAPRGVTSAKADTLNAGG